VKGLSHTERKWKIFPRINQSKPQLQMIAEMPGAPGDGNQPSLVLTTNTHKVQKG